MTVEVTCGGCVHLVSLRRGQLVLHDHTVGAEAAVFALGAPAPACFDVLRSWRSRRAWEAALQPRGPGFHQLYRRPPLPADLVPALEQGVARGWERRASRGDLLARDCLERAARAKAEPALMHAVNAARRRLGGGPVGRIEISFGLEPWVTGEIDDRATSLSVRLQRDWYRTVGHRRLAVDADRFVVARDPRPLVIEWRPAGRGWAACLAEPR